MPWSLLLNKWVLIGSAFALLSGYAGIEHWRAGKWEKQFHTFQAEVKILGEEAQRKAKEKEAKDKLTTQEAHDALQTQLDALATDNQRLRDANARRRFVPAATNSTGPTDRACFSRAELERALQNFSGETQGLIEEGDRASIISKAWQEWWNKISR